eukprot:13254176-Heterocapsa_arctica.AAC.1
MFQSNIDQQKDRDRQVAKADEERDNQIAIKAVTHDGIQVLERKDFQHEDYQQNKKPRTEEPVTQTVANN